MKYGFYGHEKADVTAVNDLYPGIRTPKDLRAEDAGRVEPENRTLGQCSIMAFLVQDIFGAGLQDPAAGRQLPLLQ